MTAPFTVLYDRVSDTVFLRVVGDLDLTSASEFRAAVSRAFESPGSDWTILDLTAVTHADAYGLRALEEVSRRASELDHHLRIRCDAPLSRLIDQSGVRFGFG